MAQETGTVKWFSNELGYGFIRSSAGAEVFVHHSDIEGGGFKTLRAGERVSFQMIADDRGPKAGLVKRKGEPQPHADSSDHGRNSLQAGRGAQEPSSIPMGKPATLAEQLQLRIGSYFTKR